MSIVVSWLYRIQRQRICEYTTIGRSWWNLLRSDEWETMEAIPDWEIQKIVVWQEAIEAIPKYLNNQGILLAKSK